MAADSACCLRNSASSSLSSQGGSHTLGEFQIGFQMSYTRTHALTGSGFGSKEMTFGAFAHETSLNAGRVVIHNPKGREDLTHERTAVLHVIPSASPPS